MVNDEVLPGTCTNEAAMIAFGLDLPVTHSIDIRALNSGSEARGSSGAVYADTGIVFHFGHR